MTGDRYGWHRGTPWRDRCVLGRCAGRLDGLPAGGLNIAYEAVDRHVAHGRGDVVAFRFLNEGGVDREITYAELAAESNRFAGVLRPRRPARGPRVRALRALPELYIAMLGSLKARCGVAPLFSAFGPEPVRQRMAAGRGRVLVTRQRPTARRWHRSVTSCPI